MQNPFLQLLFIRDYGPSRNSIEEVSPPKKFKIKVTTHQGYQESQGFKVIKSIEGMNGVRGIKDIKS